MTDLERARRMLRDWGDEADTVIADELDAARREGYEEASKQTDAVIQGFAHRWMETGAADMRERAAREARYWTASQKVADRILALPLTPEEPT